MIEVIFGLNKFELAEESKKDDETLPLFIKGKSVNSGYIKNKNFYIPDDELDNITNTLKNGLDGSGAYILKDHGYKSIMGAKSVDLLVGKVSSAVKDGRNVFYKGRIEDADLANKMRKGLVSTSSVALRAKEAFCSICGREYGHPECVHFLGHEYHDEGFHSSFKQYLPDFENKPIATIIGKGIEALEQSIVLFPAIGTATAIPMFDFTEGTEEFVNSVEEIKKLAVFETDLFDKDKSIVKNLEKIIESEKAKFTLESAKEYLEDLGYVIMRKEDLKKINLALKRFDVQDWCKAHNIDFDENLIDLNEKEKQTLLNIVEQTKSKQIGIAPDVDGDFLTSSERDKEKFRSLIFHTTKTPEQILEAREKRDNR
jgi:hypothetical protein